MTQTRTEASNCSLQFSFLTMMTIRRYRARSAPVSESTLQRQQKSRNGVMMIAATWRWCLFCWWTSIITIIIILTPVHGFGNFVLPKNIFGTNSLFTNNKETPTSTVRSNIEAQVRYRMTCHDSSEYELFQLETFLTP